MQPSVEVNPNDPNAPAAKRGFVQPAILITGLVKQEVYRTRNARYYTQAAIRPLIATDGEMLISPEEVTVTERIVPITHFCRPGRPDLYIAYSEEVEDLLGVPIRVLLKEKDEAYEALHKLQSMTAWQHVKAAWTLIKSSLSKATE